MSKTLGHEDYTVGWICPLEVEQIVAMEMLDEEHNRLPQAATDHNVYNLGSIAGHNVVIAGLYQPGNSPAATVVTQMRMTFPNLRFGLLVGIGGGVPVKTDNGMIRLGDIVVSKPAGGHSGAIQYDHGKAKAGNFERTGALAPPPAVLLNAAQDLAAKRARSRNDSIDENVKRIDTSIPGLRRYRYPGGARDHLYKPDYIHREPGVACDECGCDPSQRIQKSTIVEDERPYSVIHRGTIASGELVVKDAGLRDKLAKDHGLLCFETEAAGALADFPCIVIRGISDYCDSHKNDQWHGYAASTAAAYARQLFFHMPIDDVKRYISETAEKAIHSLKDRQDDQDNLNILDWLTTVNYGSQQSDFISRRQPGTGQWLIESAEFQTWLNSDPQVLFCPGIPGAGKTILTSIVVKDLSTRFDDNKSIGIAYLYCNFRRHEEQKVDNLLASLLRQLAENLPALPATVKELYDRHKTKRTRPSLDEITRSLHLVTTLYLRVFIVVDALDECQISNGCRQRFLSDIFNLQAQCKINLFATSRPLSTIEKAFEGNPKLEIHASEEDVRRYIDGHLSWLPGFVAQSLDLQEEVKTYTVQAVDGMFLLAQLHLESLTGKRSPKALRAALKNLATGSKAYDSAYEDAMHRINGQIEDMAELAKQVLIWITCATRPLTTWELQHALGVEVGQSELDKENFSQIEDVVSVCAGLVTVDEESEIIRLVHYTTQEYFERTQNQWFPDAQTYITTICISYLTFNQFKSGSCRTNKEFKKRLRKNKLYNYAAHHWGYHACQALTFCQNVMDFLQTGEQIEAACQAVIVVKYSPLHCREFPKQMTGLHFAAYFGVHKAVQILISSEWLNSEDSYDRTPLSWAAENGHEAVVELLLENSAEQEIKDRYGQTPLSLAAGNGHEAVVKLLLEKGAKKESKDKFGQTPLLWATMNGQQAMVKLLLEKGAKQEDLFGQTLISWLIKNRHKIGKNVLLEVKYKATEQE